MKNSRFLICFTILASSLILNSLIVNANKITSSCLDGNIALSIKEGVFNTDLCLTPDEYNIKKKYIKSEQIKNSQKGFDFNVNEWPLALAVFNEEVKRRGGLRIEGNVTNDKIKTELLNLLN